MANTRPGQREYDILLIGATGYTGSLAVQQIARHFPADLRWVIAGRCEAKLQRLRESIPAISAGASVPGTYRVYTRRFGITSRNGVGAVFLAARTHRKRIICTSFDSLAHRNAMKT